MEELLKLAANYGFPMVVAFYLLVRLEPIIKELQKSVTILTVVVAISEAPKKGLLARCIYTAPDPADSLDRSFCLELYTGRASPLH